MSRNSVGLLTIGLITVGLTMSGGCTKPTQAARPEALSVEVASVEQRDVPIYSEWIGTLDGYVNADIKAQVPGYLLKQDYTEGSFVQKGQVLFEIDPRPFEAVVDQASGQLAQANGQLSQAKAQLTVDGQRRLHVRPGENLYHRLEPGGPGDR